MQNLEHIARKVRRMRSRCDADFHTGVVQRVEDGGHVGVEAVVLAIAVGGGGVRAVGLNGRGDVGVDPEGPQGVV